MSDNDKCRPCQRPQGHFTFEQLHRYFGIEQVHIAEMLAAKTITRHTDADGVTRYDIDLAKINKVEYRSAD